MSENEYVVILDAGSQYGKVIDRRLRELNVRTEMLPLFTDLGPLASPQIKGIVISGSPGSVYDEVPRDSKQFSYFSSLFELGKPILGLCYGVQLMNYIYGGKVEQTGIREDGQIEVSIDTSSPVFHGLDAKELVLLTHGDSVTKLPDSGDFKVIATSSNHITGIQHVKKPLYGLQFHPEVDLTINGKKIFENFLFKVSGMQGNYTLYDREQISIDYIKNAVNSDSREVLVLCSGGVDSTVCAALLIKALGPKRVHALHIDNGFMRKDESKKVFEALQKYGLKLHVVDASAQFFGASTKIRKPVKNGESPEFYDSQVLSQTVHPEEKRKIIGDTFIRVTEKEVKQLQLDPNNIFLAQGTLRPDLIESASIIASSSASTIKTHHNDTELVRELRKTGKIIEPLRDYHKDEVRELGIRLGLPKSLVWRQPFPGPGLAVRILCAKDPFIDSFFNETNDVLSHLMSKSLSKVHLTKIGMSIESAEKSLEILNELKDFDLSNLTATLLPVQTVGVQGDARTYKHLCAVSGYENGNINWKLLFLLAKIIPQICHNVNRLVYLFGKKVTGPVTRITPTVMSEDVIVKLREADAVVNDLLDKYELVKKLSQMPVTLFPVGFEHEGFRSIGLRPFITSDFMTGVAAVPGKDIPESVVLEMVDGISAISGISRVAYDLTSKPPGTTEWE